VHTGTAGYVLMENINWRIRERQTDLSTLGISRPVRPANLLQLSLLQEDGQDAMPANGASQIPKNLKKIKFKDRREKDKNNFEVKTNKNGPSKSFQKQKGTNRGVPKEQKEVFQAFQ